MDNHDERRRLEAGLDVLGLSPTPGQVDHLAGHLALIRKWSSAYNLVAPGELDHLVTRHTLDSLSILPHVGEGPLLDVGTGAGFPGLPLAIVRPADDHWLVDSAGKKIRFLANAARQLDLDNVHATHGRVERFSPAVEFSTITSRAFSSLTLFAETVRHLAGPDTRLLAMKGRLDPAEIDALPEWARLDGEPVRLLVPGLGAERHLVTLRLAPPDND
ncbi:16S rRNA (guanine(527)-N(7))-methyltransferase RsmG [Marinihelvus fidelis]|uniref:Ribosomal RNA small subunit methyltransferase G n=1 Tax=Marinihelvus fidelis TaxID=2613842 RepID=A0A5N0TAD2_9GAMM|nr:16S rRNA (guanine(527)-N(7))-methyltransferase RsmG [Marinihelvus fidelis]KAA9131648.1 16S rRNA (guanine(527)-N(7))-methyltransferase RsmG [Marinihelvus fidelis]